MLTQTADGNVETYEDFGGKTQYRYDEANRLTSLTAPDGKKTTYMNDNNDTRTSTTYPGGTWQSVTLDKSSRAAGARARSCCQRREHPCGRGEQCHPLA